MDKATNSEAQTSKSTSFIEDALNTLNSRSRGKNKLLIIGTFVLLVFVISTVLLSRHHTNNSVTADPFSVRIIQTTKFTLYYPTILPAGYAIVPSTVQQPSNGVVIFDIKDAKNSTIYISEEARPEKYDVGGFFKGFSDLKQYPIADGDIAIGKLENGKLVVGSLVNNNVWIIGNTKANVPMDQMQSVFQSLISTSGNKP